MKMKYIFLLMIFIFFSCATPQPVYRISPLIRDGIWKNGVQYLAISGNNIVLNAALYEYSNDQFVMDIEVVNNSNKKVLIDPSEFYYSKSSDAEMDTESYYDFIYAINPEIQITGINTEIIEEKADYSDERAADTAIGCLALGGNIAGMAAGVPGDELIDVGDHFDDMDRKDTRHERRLYKLDKEREFWSKDVLRKTTLLSKKSITGKVVFPVYQDDGLINIHFQIAGKEYIFSLVQRVEESKSLAAY